MKRVASTVGNRPENLGVARFSMAKKRRTTLG
jgi:hypothetical protein